MRTKAVNGRVGGLSPAASAIGNARRAGDEPPPYSESPSYQLQNAKIESRRELPAGNRHRKSPLGPWIGLAWLLCASSGCTTVPEVRYFSMAYVLLPQKSPAAVTPFTLRVRELDIAPAYERERIVYRYSPYEFMYYNYMLWAVKPQRMVTDLLTRHLDRAGLFTAVATEFGEQKPIFELSGSILSLEELDSGTEWYAHLAIAFRLTRYRDERALWSYTIDARKQVFNKAPVYVVKALSELMEEEMTKMLGKLDPFVRAQIELREERP